MDLGTCRGDLPCQVKTAFAVVIPAAAVVITLASGVLLRIPVAKSILTDLISADDEHADELLDEKPSEVAGDNAHSNGATVAGPSGEHGDSAIVSEHTPLIAREHPLAEVKSPRTTRSYVFVAIGVAELATRSAVFIRDSPWKDTTRSDAVAPGIVLAVWLYATLKPLVRPPVLPPYSLLAIYLSNVFAAFVTFYLSFIPGPTHSLSTPNPLRFDLWAIAHTSLNIIGTALVLNMPMRITSGPPVKSADGINPALDDWSTVAQWMSFSWLDPLIAQGKKMALEEPDVWQLARNLRSRLILNKFTAIKGRSFMARLFKANARDLAITGTLVLVQSTLNILQPVLLNQLLSAMEMSYVSSNFTTTSAVHLVKNPSTFLHIFAADLGYGQDAPAYIQQAGGDNASLGRQKAYVFALLAFLTQLIKSEVELQMFYAGRRATLRAKTEAIGSIYEKALKRIDTSGAVGGATDDKASADSKQTAGSADMGKITSLVSTDTNRIGFFINFYTSMIQAPLSIVLAATFLYRLMGWSAFAGYVAFLIATPANHFFMKWQYKAVMRTMEMRDRRMRSMNEVIQAIKFIKFSAWESRWISRILELRDNELKVVLQFRIAMFCINFVWEVIPIIVACVSLTSFTYFAGHELSISLAFPALLTFQILTDELTQLPMALNLVQRCYASVQRIGEFLEEEEVGADVCALLPEYNDRVFDERIGCERATFVWNTSAIRPEKLLADELKKKAEEEKKNRTWRDTLTLRTFRRKPAQQPQPATDAATETVSSTTVTPGGSTREQFVLRDISVSFPRGKMTLVHGPTASGKSSLLAAILGEMKCLEGRVYLPKFPTHVDNATGLKESISFCAQQPWLESASIRDNILFGTPYERKRYNAVLAACALIPDLKILEDGDKTEIGEKGVVLSGGQKARVALARAVYAYTQTVILDDVLSAVDSHTASVLIKSCFLGPLMKGRTLILVTHHVDAIVNHCAYVVRLANGVVDVQGTVEDLRARGELPEGKEAAPQDEDYETLADEEDIVEASGKDTKDAKKLSDKETKDSGSVKGKIYITYIRAAGYWIIGLLLATILAQRGMDLGQKLWVKAWSESYEDAPNQPKDGPTKTPFGLPSATRNPLPYVFIYIGIQGSNALLSVVAQIPSIYSALRASRLLYRDMLNSVIRSPSRWFDKTPAGRILSRFSKDIDTIDTGLSWYVVMVVEQAASFAIALGVISYGVPPFIVAAVFIFYLHYYVANGYIKTSRDLNRLESTLRSPVLSAFGELLRGVATVRAFGSEHRFMKTLFDRLDRFQGAFYYMWMSSFWLRLRFGVLGAFTFFLTTVCALTFGISAGLAAIVITHAQSMLTTVYWLMRAYVEAEQAFNGIERVSEYIDLKSEPPHIIEGSRPPAEWPSSRGGITFDKTVIKYAPDLEPVLHGVSFSVSAKEKIGLVGRSGSGKSTLALSLFRFVDPAEGKIIIDGVDITSIGVEDLRSRLTLIPQDAVLFKGTLRENLDPFKEYTDAECLEVLRSVQLLVEEPTADDESQAPTLAEARGAGTPPKPSSGASTPKPEGSRIVITLESAVSEGGNNWSAGQRQLIALARALLRKTNIIVLDESTASVDFETDHKIQHAIREGFRDGIMLVIAHRLHTIIECDRILVLDAGKVVEFDTPANLIDKEDGVFRGMCLKSESFDSLLGLLPVPVYGYGRPEDGRPSRTAVLVTAVPRLRKLETGRVPAPGRTGRVRTGRTANVTKR